MFESDLVARVIRAEPRWDLPTDAPALAAQLPPALATIATALRDGVPALRDVGLVDHAPYLRPPGHRRCFYMRLPTGVLAIKGTEPHALNHAALLDELAEVRTLVELRLGSPALDRTLTRAELSGLERFPLLEGKVPGALTVREAAGEARAALAVQTAHVTTYGALARLPLPLFVGAWPTAVGAAIAGALRGRLRGRARDVVEQEIAAGLGVYAYYYPSVPLRLAHLPVHAADRGPAIASRLAALGGLEPRALLDAWIGLTARLLALGFVPKDPASLVSGDCLQVQNLVLDGGFADAESLVAVAVLDDRALRDALRRTGHELALAATRLLVGLWISTVDLRDRLPDVHAIVWDGLRARLRAEPVVDARVAAIALAESPTFDALLAVFADAL